MKKDSILTYFSVLFMESNKYDIRKRRRKKRKKNIGGSWMDKRGKKVFLNFTQNKGKGGK